MSYGQKKLLKSLKSVKIRFLKIIMHSLVDLSSSAHLLFMFLHLKPGVVVSCTKQCLLVQRTFSGLGVSVCVCH